MKKLIALTLLLLLVAGCGSGSSVKLGLGVTGYIDPTNASPDGDGRAQANVTACAVTLDSSNKIVGVAWDVSQISAAVSATGTVTPGTDLRTKKEKKEDYNMKGASPIGKEWYEQIDALEKWAVGKAASDVIGMAVTTNDHGTVPDVEDLKSSVTINIPDFLEALEKAVANAK